MFESLSEKLSRTFKKLRGQGRLTEKNIQEALKEVRMALLEADVNYKVVKKFVEDIRQSAMGKDVLDSLTPGQQVIKIVHEELIRLMGGARQELNLTGRTPFSVMLVGLQGSGKTTTAGKLALHLRKKGRNPYLVPADIYRPAAIEQLKKLGSQLGIPVHDTDKNRKPEDTCQEALARAGTAGADILIMDTAGRLHTKSNLMEELEKIHRVTGRKLPGAPHEVWLVLDATTGQNAIAQAELFHKAIGLTGLVLTKLDGTAKGGIVVGISHQLKIPIKFIGIGETMEDLRPFDASDFVEAIFG